jgi:arsenate reductase
VLLRLRDASQVLLVCVHKAGRSQMAAGFLADRAGDRVRVRSAGSAPSREVNPLVADAMREVGIDLASAVPKRLQDDLARESAVAITMGCGDACPVFPGRRYEDWVLDDPAGMGLDGIRVVRDEIARRVGALVASLDLPR